MTIATILVDNREQKPWPFDNYPVDTEGATIATGDYTLAEFCEADDNDTYHPSFAVERKSGQDFVSSITSGRSRFKREIRRADEWDAPLEVVIEAPWTTFMQELDFMRYRQVTPSQIKGTVGAWSDRYNANFFFAGTRGAAEQYAFDVLLTRLRTADSVSQ